MSDFQKMTKSLFVTYVAQISSKQESLTNHHYSLFWTILRKIENGHFSPDLNNAAPFICKHLFHLKE